MKRYYDRLRELREERGLKQRHVAELLGINQQVYSRYELGVRSLPLNMLITLCKYYKTSSDWILGLDDE